MTSQVIVEQAAEEDLSRLYDPLLGRAEYVEDLEIADRAVGAIRNTMTSPATTPFIFRKVESGGGSLRRELIVPRGSSGYVVQYEIAGPELVVVLAVRHQREEDYH
ncbi:MAG: type II toxin-antitoxin system RelE/ParE family toxin [Burkholderiales bacterium]|nr:type II toxin-antitoxin system RelE/ParE family toxin [Burkholderiales bacterium]